MNDSTEFTNNSIGFIEKSLQLGVWKLSFTDKSLSMSERLFAILEIPYKPNLSWTSIFLALGKNTQKTLLQAIKKTYQEKSETDFPLTLTTPQGRKKYLHVFLRSCIEDKNQSIEGIVQDLSEKVHLETSRKLALENSREQSLHKSIFLGNASHDLRTPLNTIIGYSDLLTEEWQSSEAEQISKDLQTIRNAGKNLLELINVVIDWANIDAERFTREEELFALEELLEDLQEHLQDSLAAKKNTLIIGNTFPQQKINSDPEKLHACLANLLLTANKFNKNAEIHLKILRQTQDTSEFIRFIVEDYGTGTEGIASNDLFIPSIHREDKGSRRHGSSGLTLNLTAKLVELLGGKVLPPEISETSTKCIFEIPHLTPKH